MITRALVRSFPARTSPRRDLKYALAARVGGIVVLVATLLATSGCHEEPTGVPAPEVPSVPLPTVPTTPPPTSSPPPPTPTPLPPAAACNAVLAGGVFNSILTSSTASFTENLTQWLRTTTYEEFNAKRSAGLTLNIFGYPESGSWDETTFHKFQSDLNSGVLHSITAAQAAQTIQLSASPEILNAWLACIRGSGGLSGSYTDNGSAVVVTVQYAPNGTEDRATVTAFSVAGASVAGGGLGVGDTIPAAGRAVLLQWADTLAPVTVVVNTDRGTLIESVPAKPRTPLPPAAPVPPPLRIQTFHLQTAALDIPNGRLTVPIGYKVLSCGARVNWTGYGQLLTDVHVEDEHTCVAASKAVQISDPSTLDVWAIALADSADAWEWTIRTATSAAVPLPCATVQLPQGWALTGGGGLDHWSAWGGYLTVSRPEGTMGWTACAVHHMYVEATSITAYVVGIRPRNGVPAPVVQIVAATGDAAEHPSARAELAAGVTLTGGGAEDHWVPAGNLLTASFPEGSGWSAAGKDHGGGNTSVTSVTAYAIGLSWPPR